jgi:glycosyltransferase involved in cell wall biosynthesis
MFSIVTPSYNQAEFIRDTLESVRCQSRDDIDHIVIDGESDDGTLDVLREYDNDITWISEPDQGQADAINKGFDRADGDIIGWLNSDDVYFDRTVLDRVATYFARTGADIVYGDIGLIDAASDIMKLRCVPDWNYARLRRGCFIEQPALFFRRKVLAEERLDTGLDFAMDYEFWLRLGKAYDFHHVDDILAGDRNHHERKILNRREEMLHEAVEIAGKYGASSGIDHRLRRLWDITTSGLPRRVRAMSRTVEMHRDTPDFAFDGGLYPIQEMMLNVFRPNRLLT